MNEFVEMFGGAAEDKVETRALLTGYLNRFDTDARARGVPNDVPLAIVTAITNLSSVYAGTPAPSTDRIMDLRYALAIELTRAGALMKMNDEQKQRAYEMSLMIAGMVQTLCERAKQERNTEELKNCKLVAAMYLEMYGVRP